MYCCIFEELTAAAAAAAAAPGRAQMSRQAALTPLSSQHDVKLAPPAIIQFAISAPSVKWVKRSSQRADR